jgi:DnaJ-class molecular chaperone
MSDYGTKECTKCEGSGKLGGDFGYDCDDCDGVGEVDRTLEDHQDEIEYWAEMRGDEKRHGL